MGSGCGSVGRAVTSNTKGPQFEASHWKKIIYLLNICLLSTVYGKDKIKKKEAGNGPFFKKPTLVTKGAQMLQKPMSQINLFKHSYW